MTVAVSGCLRSRSSTSTTSAPAQTLTLKGAVRTVDGQPRQGIHLFIDNASTAAGITDGAGAFTVSLTDAELTTLGAAAPLGKGTFNVYFEGDDLSQRAVSSAIGYSERGDKDLGILTLTPAATVRGQVLTLATGRRPLPAAGALVVLGRAQVAADADGHFSLGGIPAGAASIAASALRMATATRNLTLAPGQILTLDAPLVLFNETGVQGMIVPQPPEAQAVLNQEGHPFLRTFRVVASTSAAFIRMAHDPALLAVQPGPPWQPLPATFDYDFPRDGGHVLYYQFADSTQTTLSEIYSQTVIIDQYAGGTGFTVEDGSGVVARRDVILNVNVPPSAYRMRIAESPGDVEKKPWVAAMAAYPYVIGEVRDASDNLLGYGMRTIYLQFIDAFGFLSPVYQQTVALEMFPPTPTPVFQIEHGAPVVTNRLVRLDVTIPTNARSMLISEGDTSSGGRSLSSLLGGGGEAGPAWLEASPVAYYVFNSPGLKRLHLQFRALDGATSPVYEQLIRVDPFADGGIGFTINGNAPMAPSRYLDITLHPPVQAVAFQIMDLGSSVDSQAARPGSSSGGGFGENEWITLVPQFHFEANGAGVRTLLVKFKTLDGDESEGFTQSIYIDPFPPGTGDLIVNSGAPIALLPSLHLDIVPPVNAVAMAVTEGIPPSDFNTDWLELANEMELTVAGTGPKTIYVRFKAADGAWSPSLQRTIFYEPFPYASAGLTLNHDDATTSDPNVTLQLFGLPNLLKMRWSENEQDLQTLQFQQFSTTATYTFSPDLGTRKIYVQYATAGGETSPIYVDEIQLVP